MDLDRSLKVTEYEDCVGIEFNLAYLTVDKSQVDLLIKELKPYRQTFLRRIVKWLISKNKYNET